MRIVGVENQEKSKKQTINLFLKHLHISELFTLSENRTFLCFPPKKNPITFCFTHSGKETQTRSAAVIIPWTPQVAFC